MYSVRSTVFSTACTARNICTVPTHSSQAEKVYGNRTYIATDPPPHTTMQVLQVTVPMYSVWQIESSDIFPVRWVYREFKSDVVVLQCVQLATVSTDVYGLLCTVSTYSVRQRV